MTSVHRDIGRFLYQGHWWSIVASSSRTDANGALPLQPNEAASIARDWRDDPSMSPVMLRLYEELNGTMFGPPSARDLEHASDSLSEALARGSLVVLREPRPKFRPPQQAKMPPPPAPKASKAVKDKHFLDVTLQEQDGAPLPDLRYRLQLPDATTEEGQLDPSGRIYKPDVPEGTAWFWILPEQGDPIEAEDIGSDTADA